MRLCSCGNPSAYKSTQQGRDCRACRSKKANAWNKQNYPRVRGRILKQKFGINLEQYRAMEKAQGAVCAICKEPNSDRRAFAVDHDHETGVIRGLLCGNCNRGIGSLRESPAILYRAIEYLNKT